MVIQMWYTEVGLFTRLQGKSRKHSSGYRSNYIANQVITRFSNLLTGLNLTDIETGYKAFTREVAQNLAPTLVSRSFGGRTRNYSANSKTKSTSGRSADQLFQSNLSGRQEDRLVGRDQSVTRNSSLCSVSLEDSLACRETA